MNKTNLNLQKNKFESWYIYKMLCNSDSMYNKCLQVESGCINECLGNTVTVLVSNYLILITGSAGEGTRITAEDYGKGQHSTTLGYISDLDIMNVLCQVRVIDERDTLPQEFDNYIYYRAERGKHTTDGFRKLRIIHNPENYSLTQQTKVEFAHAINMAIEHGFISRTKVMASKQNETVCLPQILYYPEYNLTRQYRARQLQPSMRMTIEDGYMSSSKFLADSESETVYIPEKDQSTLFGIGTQGPSQIVAFADGSTNDFVECFYVKSWPKEAESWFSRQTRWPNKKLKSKIKKIGYLLVPTGNSNSQESDLEWRCSFSLAENILFQSMTKFQRYTFVMLKVLFKEYLPADINTDGEKQLLSSYHIKTLFLWSLGDSRINWEPENMLDIIGHLLDELSEWINRQFFPHYFIPSVNLLNSRRIHGRKNALTCFITAIGNDLSNKILESKFFKGQKSVHIPDYILKPDTLDGCITRIYDHVMRLIKGVLQFKIHFEVFENISPKLRLSVLIENIISINPEIDPQMQYLYTAIYSDPIHDKLLTEVVPGLIDQYRGCIHLAKYCMAARDGHVLPGILYTAEALLKDTLHLDPCLGYVKLACLYIATGDLVRVMAKLHVAENNFLSIHNNMVISALKNLKLDGVEVNRFNPKLNTVFPHEVFQKWVEGQVTSSIVVTWPEYTTVPDLLQFELIQESTQQVMDVQYEHVDEPGKMVGLNCYLQWPPLSMIKLLKFICAFNSSQSSTSHMGTLVADLIASSSYLVVSPFVNDIYTVFNMAAWCYVKIKKYKAATQMMTVAIGSRSESEVMKRCAFSHQFMAYIMAQCLAKRIRVLVYK